MISKVLCWILGITLAILFMGVIFAINILVRLLAIAIPVFLIGGVIAYALHESIQNKKPPE
jgi:hypothetical protein